MGRRLPRKLAAILYADVAGYSRLTGNEEDATHRTLSEYLDFIVQAISAHNGKEMHYAGDAVLASAYQRLWRDQAVHYGSRGIIEAQSIKK